MERNNKDVNFEDFIKKTADQYRMYPSEDVWNGVHKTLHPRKKWYGFGLGLLLVSSGLSVMFLINTKKTNLKEISEITPVQTETLTGNKSNNLLSVSPKTISAEEMLISDPKELITLNKPINIQASLPQIKENNNKLLTIQYPLSDLSLNRSDEATDQDEYYNGFKNNQNQQRDKVNEITTDNLLISPLTIESVLNSYTRIKRKNKLLF